MKLPKRITRRWLRDLDDQGLHKAYLEASAEYDASYACVNRNERWVANRRLQRILNEHERRKGERSGESKRPFSSA